MALARPDSLAFAPGGSHGGLCRAVVDPYVNAIHVTLLREKQGNPDEAAAFKELGVGSQPLRTLAERLLAEGPDALSPQERLAVLSDPELMAWLHEAAWARSPAQLAPWWSRCHASG